MPGLMGVLIGAFNHRGTPVSLNLLSSAIVSGKTVLVTGANTGLGLEAARHYAQLGASRVILGVRTESKGEAAKQNIESSLSTRADIPRPQIDIWAIDLSSYASVQRFAKRVNEELDSLDIAVLNAAVSRSNLTLTKDGWDESLQVNMLSAILLGLLILPKLQASSDVRSNWIARLDFVASRAHQYVKDGESWQSESNILQALNQDGVLRGAQRYGTSKLLLIYGVREIVKLATKSDGKPSVIVNYTCPGPCKSDLVREWQGSVAGKIAVSAFHSTFCKTAEEGSRTIVWATCLGEESHGKWIHNDQIEE